MSVLFCFWRASSFGLVRLHMDAAGSNGSDASRGSGVIVGADEPRASRSVTAGMTDAEFEAWLVAQGAVPMSDERRRRLNLDGSGALSML